MRRVVLRVLHRLAGRSYASQAVIAELERTELGIGRIRWSTGLGSSVFAAMASAEAVQEVMSASEERYWSPQALSE